MGAGVGWYAAYTARFAEANRRIQQANAFLGEQYDQAVAGSALKAIPIIESGDKTQAVEWFARPIAHYSLIFGQWYEIS